MPLTDARIIATAPFLSYAVPMDEVTCPPTFGVPRNATTTAGPCTATPTHISTSTNCMQLAEALRAPATNDAASARNRAARGLGNVPTAPVATLVTSNRRIRSSTPLA